MAIKHAKTVVGADDGVSEVQGSDWNADHTGTNSHTHQGASEGSDLRASAAEVLAGTSEAKFATPKAIKDAGINPNVSNTGWIAVADAWTYYSATKITVPSGAGNYYQRGDRLKWVANGANLQAIIVKVQDQLLTVRGDAVTNYSMSQIYYSHMDNPLGWRDWFSFTSSGPTNATILCKFKLFGHSCHVVYRLNLTGAPDWSSGLVLPVKVISTIDSSHFWYSSYTRSVGIGRYGKLVSQAYPYNTVLSIKNGDLYDPSGNMVDITTTSPCTWTSGDALYLEIIYEWGETD